jgi:hypothetical protein
MEKIDVLQLEMLKTLDLDNFRGKKVAEDMLAHQELWRSVMLEFKWKIHTHIYIKEFWMLWKLYIATKPGQEDALRNLAKTWNPGGLRFTGEGHWKPIDNEPFYTWDEKVEQNPKLYLEL